VGDIHRVNALKTFLAACINVVSVAVWVLEGKVRWDLMPGMAVAAVVGGYLGARLGLRVPKGAVRWLGIAIGFGLATYYFHKQLTAAP
jgi:uncharacterized membrane protein YfcA